MFFTTPEFVIIGIGVVLFLGTELFYERKRKHFVATLIFVLSVVVGFNIHALYDVRSDIQTWGGVIHDITNSELRDDLIGIFAACQQDHFDRADERLRVWNGFALRKIRSDLESGYVALNASDGIRQISSFYEVARESIVATNLGSLETYFNQSNSRTESYRKKNLKAYDNCVPVVRVFVAKDEGATKNSEFLTQARKLHDDLKTLWSGVLFVKDPTAAIDVLLIDGVFFAETVFDEDRVPKQIRASQKPSNVNRVTRRIDELHNQVRPEHIIRMPDEEILDHFQNLDLVTRDLMRAANPNLADRIAEAIVAGKLKTNGPCDPVP